MSADVQADPLEAYRDIQDRIAAAAKTAGRDPAEVTLTAVTKTHGEDRIRPVLEAGHRVFGENRVQEAQGKWPEPREAFPDLELRLIGPLQTNKVKDACALFDVLETVDREKLARALAKERERAGALPRLLVQVNTGEEPQKAGVLPAEAEDFLAFCRGELDLPVEGVMCIPPADEPPAPHFGLLVGIARRAGLPVVSMGMSGDYETAVKLGATHVRVGSALFGAREG